MVWKLKIQREKCWTIDLEIFVESESMILVNRRVVPVFSFAFFLTQCRRRFYSRSLEIRFDRNFHNTKRNNQNNNVAKNSRLFGIFTMHLVNLKET